MDRQTVIPLDQVMGIEIRCECGMEGIFGIEPDFKTICPGCKGDLGTVALAIRSLRTFVEKDKNRRIAFRISQSQ